VFSFLIQRKIRITHHLNLFLNIGSAPIEKERMYYPGNTRWVLCWQDRVWTWYEDVPDAGNCSDFDDRGIILVNLEGEIMKLRLIVAGLLFAILAGSAAVAASNYNVLRETGECTLEMMEESCPDEMVDSGECDAMMGSGPCQEMMEHGHSSALKEDSECPGMDDADRESGQDEEGDSIDMNMSSMMEDGGCSGMDSDSASGMAQMMV